MPHCALQAQDLCARGQGYATCEGNRSFPVSAGVGKMTWLIDFEGYSLRNAPPISVALKTLNVLQNHYPERLGLAVCYHPPRLFSLTWKVSLCLVSDLSSCHDHQPVNSTVVYDCSA